MKPHWLSLARGIGLGIMFVFLSSAVAIGAELKVLSTTAVQEVAAELGAQFERVNGHRVTFVFEPQGTMQKRMAGGETGDILIFPAQAIEDLVKSGAVAMNDVRPFARSSVGVAVRRGTPKPDISSPEAFRRAMLSAKSVIIGDPARGGLATPHLFKVFDKLGITEEMKHKLIYKKIGGAAGNVQAMAETDSNMGVGQLSEYAPVSTMEIVGPLPGDLNLTSLYSTVIVRGTNDAAAGALLDFMRTPEAAAALRKQGLEPAFP